jgi:predicted RNA-binding Zn ribbon-like protein
MISPSTHSGCRAASRKPIGPPKSKRYITKWSRPSDSTDLLDNPGALQAWLTAQRDRLDIPDGKIDLGAVKALRAHITDAIHAARGGSPPPPEALRAINAAMRNAPLYQEVGWSGEAATTTARRHGDATAVLLGQLAGEAAALMASPSIGLVRRCQGPDCRMLFLPANPRRRWCSPSVCGNRARVARYYQRHKDVTPRSTA